MDKQIERTRRVLITGGSGLIGGRVAEFLARSGLNVRLGTRKKFSPDFISPIGAELVHTDWEDFDSLRAICRDVDVIINAMGMSAGDCQRDPVGALMVNGVYTASLLKAAISSGVKRFVHLSTAHVYGVPLEGTISEFLCPTNLHPYATSHRAGEDVVLWGDRQKDIESVVVRLSNAYGRPIDPKTSCWMLMVNDLCRQAVEEKCLTLHSDGLQHRDFIPLSNVCRFISHLSSVESISLVKNNRAVAPIFNLGSGHSMSVATMAEIIQSRCQSVLGYPVLLRKMPFLNERKKASLQYISENLFSPIEVTMEDAVNEIDELLMFCWRNFRI